MTWLTWAAAALMVWCWLHLLGPAHIGRAFAWLFGLHGPGCRLGWALARPMIERERQRDRARELARRLDAERWRARYPNKPPGSTAVSCTRAVWDPGAWRDTAWARAARTGTVDAATYLQKVRAWEAMLTGREKPFTKSGSPGCEVCGAARWDCPRCRNLDAGRPSPVNCLGESY